MRIFIGTIVIILSFASSSARAETQPFDTMRALLELDDVSWIEGRQLDDTCPQLPLFHECLSGGKELLEERSRLWNWLDEHEANFVSANNTVDLTAFDELMKMVVEYRWNRQKYVDKLAVEMQRVIASRMK